MEIQVLPDNSLFWENLEILGYKKCQFFFPGFPGADNIPVSLEKLMEKIHLKTGGFVLGVSSETPNDNGCHKKVILDYQDISGNISKINAHIKSVPLLDIIDVLKGKYLPEKVISCLPSRERELDRTYEKINDSNNQAYVDCLAGYVLNTLKNKCPGFPNFYGHFTGITPQLKVDITEDFYSIRNEAWFHRGIGSRFTIEVNDSAFGGKMTGKQAREIHITDEEFGFTEDLKELAEDPEIIAREWNEEDNEGVEEVYVYNENESDDESSEGSVSMESEDTEEENDTDTSESDDDDFSDYSDYSDDSDDIPDEGVFFAIIPNMPVQSAIYETLEGPIDTLLGNPDIETTEWLAILFQICFSLAIAQQNYSFVHNDLHTNNIMWIPTTKEYIVYKVNDNFYKIPTYGKIIKIIDYGRSYFKYLEKEYISDAYRPRGDAAGQYNYPPYFNPRETRVPPNPSFDLPRLACSMYEALYDPDTNPEKDILSSLLHRWLIDVRGKSILWNKKGEERFVGFLLYKHIARYCQNIIPFKELENQEFRIFNVKENDLIFDYEIKTTVDQSS